MFNHHALDISVKKLTYSIGWNESLSKSGIACPYITLFLENLLF